MILAALGWVGALLGLAGSLALALTAWRAARRPGSVRRRQLTVATAAVLGGASLAMLALEIALLTDDFAVSYVAGNSSRATPVVFKITAGWSGLAGSIVLWGLVLAGFTAMVLRQLRDMDDRLGLGALVTMGVVSAFFFAMITTVANPFGIVADPPADGPGPNALLQNHIMVAIHPPLLYVGFVGFTVPFAYALSALALGRAGVEWLRRTRRANLLAWSFLTAGLLVGAWWSYEVLGWGGFWAWDPVENAALIPWLVATAFVHSAVVQVKRGVLQLWNLVLVVLTFALTILGTFLTRSSVIASVHSFTQSAVGPVLLAFFFAVLVVGFGLIALRATQLASPGRLDRLFSREGAFLVNNLLLSVLAFVVLVGTLFPILVEAATGDQVSVGRPFFDRMAVPLGLAMLLAMGVGPFLPYRAASGRLLWERQRLPLLLAAAAAAGLVLSGVRSVGVVLVVLLGTAVGAATVGQLVRALPEPRPRPLWRLLRGQRGYWGGQLSHLGVVLVALAIALSAGMSDRTTVTLDAGQSVEFAGRTFTFAGTERRQEPQRVVDAARVEIRDGGRLVRVAEPSLNGYPSQRLAVASPSVWTQPDEDVYVALSDYSPEQVTLSLYRYPLMWLLWAGGLLASFGGLWALLPAPRRRGAAAPRAEPQPVGQPVGQPVVGE